MKDRPLFLRWFLINAFLVVASILLGSAYSSHIHIHGTSLAIVPIVFAVTLGMIAYSGVLFWKADGVRLDHRERIIHQAEHVFFAIAICQLLGLLGAQLGIYIISQANTTAGVQEATHNILTGLGTGLIATIVGVLCSLVLAIEHHILVHNLSKP